MAKTVKYIDGNGLIHYEEHVQTELAKKQDALTEAQIANLNIDHSQYALKDDVPSDVYTKTETDTAIANKVAEIVNENNNGSVDTLNEIASWIVNDTTGAAKMAADINSLESDKLDEANISAYTNDEIDKLLNPES